MSTSVDRIGRSERFPNCDPLGGGSRFVALPFCRQHVGVGDRLEEGSDEATEQERAGDDGHGQTHHRDEHPWEFDTVCQEHRVQKEGEPDR